ncbi:MAG: GIY-YIG nuclease family protein [Sphaerospermopsis kisseleviana]
MKEENKNQTTQYLRDWQNNALTGYLERSITNVFEVTAAYQGTGKTIYSAACFISSVIGLDLVKNHSLSEINKNYKNFGSHNKFAIVVVPLRCIIPSTIEAWKDLGVNLRYMSNKMLLNNTPDKLKRKGFDGIIVTYSQLRYFGHAPEQGEWSDAPFVKFLKTNKSFHYYGILDECHTMTIKVNPTTSELIEPNQTAEFMLGNHHLFRHLHLLSGTPVKANSDKLSNFSSVYGLYSNRIPFVSYDSEGKVLPDTLYSQEDAIKEGVIVKTSVTTLSIDKLHLTLNGKNLKLTDSDLTWLSENVSETVMKNHFHPYHDRLREIDKSFKALYTSNDLWQQMIIIGEDKLGQVQSYYEKAIGLIFAPTVESAMMIQNNLLQDTSLICFSKADKRKFNNCNGADAETIHKILQQQKGKIKWVINCLTLKEGFDYPDCKVSIMLPPLNFLNLCRISQMLGRTNRSIKGYPNILARCITLRYPSVEKLIEIEKDSRFGICVPDTYIDRCMVVNNYLFHEKQLDEIDISTGKRDRTKDIVEIKDFLLANKVITLNESGRSVVSLSGELKHKLSEISIKSYWYLWEDIVKFPKTDFDPSKLPKNQPGVYIIANAKTTEILYVGQSKRLLERISSRQRYLKLWWKNIEGWDNLFIRWFYTDNDPRIQEEFTKKELKPKYDDEKPVGYVA